MSDSRLNTVENQHAHYFDFDGTLTNVHVYDWHGQENAPDAEACKKMLKPGVLETFRMLWARGDYIAIITNGSIMRISHVLSMAGLTSEELNKLEIHGANSDYIVTGYKSGTILDLSAGKFKAAKEHFFYDDRPIFTTEVEGITLRFASVGKSLTVIKVPDLTNNLDSDNYNEHLLAAQQQASRKSPEKQEPEQPTFLNNIEDLPQTDELKSLASDESEQPTSRWKWILPVLLAIGVGLATAGVGLGLAGLGIFGFLSLKAIGFYVSATALGAVAGFTPTVVRKCMPQKNAGYELAPTEESPRPSRPTSPLLQTDAESTSSVSGMFKNIPAPLGQPVRTSSFTDLFCCFFSSRRRISVVELRPDNVPRMMSPRK